MPVITLPHETEITKISLKTEGLQIVAYRPKTPAFLACHPTQRLCTRDCKQYRSQEICARYSVCVRVLSLLCKGEQFNFSFIRYERDTIPESTLWEHTFHRRCEYFHCPFLLPQQLPAGFPRQISTLLQWAQSWNNNQHNLLVVPVMQMLGLSLTASLISTWWQVCKLNWINTTVHEYLLRLTMCQLSLHCFQWCFLCDTFAV